MNYERIDAFAGKTLKIFRKIFQAFTKVGIAFYFSVLHSLTGRGYFETSAIVHGLAAEIPVARCLERVAPP